MIMQPNPWTRSVFLIVAVCRIALSLSLTIAAEPKPPMGVLRFNNGDYIEGELAESNDVTRIAWQHPQFAAPFAFAVSTISNASFPMTQEPKPTQGSFGLELWGGDRLFGSIIGIDDESIQLQTENIGEIRVSRKQVRSLFRWQNGEAATSVNCGTLDGWRTEGQADKWMHRGGQLRSDEPDVWLYRDVGLAAQARIDIEISWEKKPNFVIALGVNPIDPIVSAVTAFRIEVWGEKLVAIWELDDVADIAVVGKIDDMKQELRLTIELDQEANQAIVLSEHGEELAKLKLDPPGGRVRHPGFWLKNISGTVTLNSLLMIPGNRLQATTASKAKDIFHLPDQRILKGSWSGVEDDVWMIKDAEMTHRINASELLQVNLAKIDNDVKRDAEAKPNVQLKMHDGMRLTGVIEKLSAGQINFRPVAASEIVIVSLDNLRKLSVVGSQAATSTRFTGSNARLETTDTRIHGRLVDAPAGTMPTPIRFEPAGSKAISMQPGFSGRLVYQDPVPKPSVPVRVVQRVPAAPLDVLGVLTRAFANRPETQPVAPKALYLRSGEVIPCNITAIDAEGIVFQSSMTTQTRLSHEHVRAVHLIPGKRELTMEDLKRQRLLTVPRAKKKNPPTHLIVASNGDVMRCTLNRLTDKIAEVETRLETIEIDRALIAQILWLDSVDALATDDDPPVEAPTESIRIRVILRDGNQMSMEPQSFINGELFGIHPVLGETRIRVNDVNELLFGDVIPTSSDVKPFESWRLSDSPEPMILDDDGGELTPGMNSALVGTQAPEFMLDLLGGGQFTLSEKRGKVVVLDFWATWCGPCLQAMPVIDETVNSFEDDDVVLVAINLQEAEEPIRATLKRLKIEPIVALDIDGVAAARYQADAIPQTVVIDREGKVSSLFVGGGAKLGVQLREAIQNVLNKNQDAP